MPATVQQLIPTTVGFIELHRHLQDLVTTAAEQAPSLYPEAAVDHLLLDSLHETAVDYVCGRFSTHYWLGAAGWEKSLARRQATHWQPAVIAPSQLLKLVLE